MERFNGLFIGYILFIYAFGHIVGQCVFPEEWNSTWYDSRTSKITMNQTSGSVDGWSVNVKPVAVIVGTSSSWTCVYSAPTNNRYALRSDNQITVYSGNYYIYICIEVTKLTDYSYSYYLLSDPLPDAEKQRVKLINVVDSPTLEDLCTFTSGPMVEQFHVLVKKGNEVETKQYCPSPMLGTFSYDFDDGKPENCGNTSQWDVCSDRNTMMFNYTLCNITQAHSKEGEVYCLTNVQNGDIYYLSVLNPGTVDNTQYYRFTCFAIQMNGSDIFASQHPGDCEIGQSPTSRPTGGSLIILSPYYTCPFTTPAALIQTTVLQTTTAVASASTETVALIAGVILGVTALLLLVFSIAMLCKKCKMTTVNKVHEKSKNEAVSHSPVPTPREHDKQRLAPLDVEALQHLPNGIEPAFKAPLPPISAR